MSSDTKGDSGRLDPRRVKGSASYREALARASKLVRKPDKLRRLAEQARRKADRNPQGIIGETRENLYRLFRLLTAYARGDYRGIAWSSLVMVVAAVIYFLSPIDLLPDFLLGFGFLDDAAILSWTMKAVSDELTKFRAWERTGSGGPAPPVDSVND